MNNRFHDYHDEDFSVSRRELISLIDAMLCGEISREDAGVLKSVLRNSPSARLLYLEYVAVQNEILRHAGHYNPGLKATRRSGRRLLTLSVVVAVTVLCGLFVFLFVGSSPDAPQTARVAPEQNPVTTVDEGVVDLEPPIVALLSFDESRTEWVDTELTYVNGMELHSGDTLELSGGVVEVVFRSGARAVVSCDRAGSPACLSLVSAAECALEEGTASFVVPPRAKGFAVQTPDGRVVDLGTEFGLTVGTNRETEVHVVRGVVEASAGSGQPHRLLSGHAVSLSRHLGTPRAVEFREELFASQLAYAVGIEGFSKNVVIHHRQPTRVTHEDLGNYGKINLIRERMNVPLSSKRTFSAFAVQFEEASQAQGASDFVVSAGTRVDSFLVHFSAGHPGRERVDASIRFRRPIAAVIGEITQLQQSTTSFCIPNASYPSQDGFGIEVDGTALKDDRLWLSSDRRVLHVSLSTSASHIDQLRILVASDLGAEFPPE